MSSKKNRIWKLFIIVYFFSIFYTYITSYFFLGEDQCPKIYQLNEFFSDLTLFNSFIFFGIGAVVETFIFSTMILYLLENTILIKHTTILLLISAVPFGIMHYTCLNLILITYFMGVFLNYFYLNVRKNHSNSFKPFTYTTLLHFSINITTQILEIIFT